MKEIIKTRAKKQNKTNQPNKQKTQCTRNRKVNWEYQPTQTVDLKRSRKWMYFWDWPEKEGTDNQEEKEGHHHRAPWQWRNKKEVLCTTQANWDNVVTSTGNRSIEIHLWRIDVLNTPICPRELGISRFKTHGPDGFSDKFYEIFNES